MDKIVIRPIHLKWGETYPFAGLLFWRKSNLNCITNHYASLRIDSVGPVNLTPNSPSKIVHNLFKHCQAGGSCELSEN